MLSLNSSTSESQEICFSWMQIKQIRITMGINNPVIVLLYLCYNFFSPTFTDSLIATITCPFPM